ncbi:MAG: hypothetical protein WCH21_05325 [Bacteroidota bacterium]
MQKLPKQIENRIAEINAMLPQIANLDHFVYTYAGGTWPYLINIEPIQINGLKVIIKAMDEKVNYKTNYITREAYKASDPDNLENLKYDLSVILRAFKKALK